MAGAGGVLYKITGNKHAFGLDDPRISFPLRPNTISITVVAVVALAAPGIIIAVLSLLLNPLGTLAGGKRPQKSLLWRRKLWEWNTGWMGLALSLASAFFITSGLKDLVGKPRPDLIARCDPDISQIQEHLVGGLGLLFEEAPIIVDVSICRQTDMSILNDGFASFPSGHSSFSWAGLFYLTLWLCMKFSISIPYLAPTRYQTTAPTRDTDDTVRIQPRSQAAAPPLYLLVLALIPTGAALYVCASRWNDYQHEGFDIIAGSLIGAVFAWGGFRYYHLPIQRGAGWSWGPRSRDRAFYAGTASGGFVGVEGWESKSCSPEREYYEDLELGNLRSGVGNPVVAGGRSDGGLE